jgi:heme-degrading monooxygenase HmoA
MFTRIVEIKAQSKKGKEVANLVHEEVLPLLKQQAGFVDELVLVSNTEPDRVIGISFWRTQEDAERYNRELFPKVTEILRPHAQGSPEVRTFNGSASTIQSIAAVKAA